MLFDSTTAEFSCAFDLAESVARLRAATKRSGFASLDETAAVGTVAQDRVRLRRVIPMVRNSFQPIFIGRFESRRGCLVLAGKFTMSPVVKIIMTLWFVMVSVFALAALIGAYAPQGPHALLFRLQPLLMICFGFAIVAAGKWLARNDAAWLTRVISEALGDARAPVTRAGADASVGGPPVVLKVAAGFLVLSGLMSLATGFFGFFIATGMPQITLLPPAWYEVFGLASIALSAGVWNRMRWAWWGGFLVLGVSPLAAWFAVPPGIGAVVPKLALSAMFLAMGGLITAVWGRWWYAQRRHFR
jgi:hypothetical protein